MYLRFVWLAIVEVSLWAYYGAHQLFRVHGVQSPTEDEIGVMVQNIFPGISEWSKGSKNATLWWQNVWVPTNFPTFSDTSMTLLDEQNSELYMKNVLKIDRVLKNGTLSLRFAETTHDKKFSLNSMSKMKISGDFKWF